jgi:hypothetical protein
MTLTSSNSEILKNIYIYPSNIFLAKAVTTNGIGCMSNFSFLFFPQIFQIS